MNIPVLDMMIRSGWVGRIIVVLLIVCSFISWAIVFSRMYVLGRISGGNKKFRKRFDSITKLTEIESLDSVMTDSPMGQLGRAGSLEYKRIIDDAKAHTAVKDWSFFLQNQFAIAAEQVESAYLCLIAPFDKGLLFLAMTSSIAPFLGLLGTVWGIMNSFFEIGNQGSASLPVVAPGIAEALVTTIVGLAVAIPSLFFYNYFNHQAGRIETEMDEFKELLLARLKRDIFGVLYIESSRPPVAPGQRF